MQRETIIRKLSALCLRPDMTPAARDAIRARIAALRSL